MKLHLKSLAVVLGITAAFAIAPSNAQAQSRQRVNVGQALSGLINVAVGAVNVNIGDITDVVDVGDVLSGNDIRILNNVLNNSPILSNNENIDILTNLLRDAEILNNNQVVVGILSGGIVLVQ